MTYFKWMPFFFSSPIKPALMVQGLSLPLRLPVEKSPAARSLPVGPCPPADSGSGPPPSRGPPCLPTHASVEGGVLRAFPRHWKRLLAQVTGLRVESTARTGQPASLHGSKINALFLQKLPKKCYFSRNVFAETFKSIKTLDRSFLFTVSKRWQSVPRPRCLAGEMRAEQKFLTLKQRRLKPITFFTRLVTPPSGRTPSRHLLF